MKNKKYFYTIYNVHQHLIDNDGIKQFSIDGLTFRQQYSTLSSVKRYLKISRLFIDKNSDILSEFGYNGAKIYYYDSKKRIAVIRDTE